MKTRSQIYKYLCSKKRIFILDVGDSNFVLGLAFEKKFVLRYLQLKRYTNFEFIVIQNLNVIQLWCLSLFSIKTLFKFCVYRYSEFKCIYIPVLKVHGPQFIFI